MTLKTSVDTFKAVLNSHKRMQSLKQKFTQTSLNIFLCKTIFAKCKDWRSCMYLCLQKNIFRIFPKIHTADKSVQYWGHFCYKATKKRFTWSWPEQKCWSRRQEPAHWKHTVEGWLHTESSCGLLTWSGCPVLYHRASKNIQYILKQNWILKAASFPFLHR